MKINIPMLIWDVVNLPSIWENEKNITLQRFSKDKGNPPTREELASIHATAGLNALGRVAIEVFN